MNTNKMTKNDCIAFISQNQYLIKKDYQIRQLSMMTITRLQSLVLQIVREYEDTIKCDKK